MAAPISLQCLRLTNTVNRHRFSKDRHILLRHQRTFFHLPKTSTNKIQVVDRILVGYSAEQLFEVVAQVEKYEQFLPWCQKSLVNSRRNNHIEATIVVGFYPLRESITSSVTLVRPNYIKSESYNGTLFHSLNTVWRFGPGIADNPSQTSTLDFCSTCEFRSVVHSKLMQLFLDEVIHKMAGAFLDRARQCYGKESIKPKKLSSRYADD